MRGVQGWKGRGEREGHQSRGGAPSWSGEADEQRADPGRRSEDVGGRGRANFDTMRVFVFEDYDSRIRALQHTTHTSTTSIRSVPDDGTRAPGHSSHTPANQHPSCHHDSHSRRLIGTTEQTRSATPQSAPIVVCVDRYVAADPAHGMHMSAHSPHTICHEPHSQSERNAPAHVEFTTEWGQINVEPAGRKRKSIKRGEGPPVGQRGSSDRRSSN